MTMQYPTILNLLDACRALAIADQKVRAAKVEEVMQKVYQGKLPKQDEISQAAEAMQDMAEAWRQFNVAMCDLSPEEVKAL